MLERVLGQVFGTLEDVDKDPFGWNVSVDGAWHKERWEGQSVGDPLDQNTGASLEVERISSAIKNYQPWWPVLTKAGLAMYCPA
jgi:hypothetical protein